MIDSEKVEYELRGKTLKIYLYMLKQGKPVGVREVQRELGLSSPSVAFHHLDKLMRLNVVEKDQMDNYVIAKKVDPGILQAFISIGRFSVPRVGFYAAFFTTVAMAYIAFNLRDLSVLAVVGTLGASAIFWYELLRIWNRKPF